jgi:hypothetical protein
MTRAEPGARPHATERPHVTGTAPRGTSPFGPSAPSVVLAGAFAAAALAWAVWGDLLPGGRWLAVHLFTLGVLTNLVLTFSEHFSRTLTRTPGERAPWWPLVTNAGVLAVIVGLPTGSRVLLAAGATIVTVAVFEAYRRIRRMRRQALGARFAWIVRVYERAHGAFLHGAVLGLLLGIGVLGGGWYGGVRLAHLHANVLGWGGLTLLATLVFFGPTMARTRIRPGADARAAKALRVGATGLTIAVLALVAAALPGPPGSAARLVAAASLVAYAWAATAVVAPVIAAVRGGHPGAPRPLILATCAWMIVVVWADVAMVATGAWRWADAVGLAALVGVLGQAILATMTYLTPMLRGRTTATRDALRLRLDRGSALRAVGFNLGVALIVLGHLGAPTSTVGWPLVAVVLVATAAVALWPVGTEPT